MSGPFRPKWLEEHRVHLQPMERSSVIGIGHVMAEIESLLARLRQPEVSRSLGLELPRGILFWGDPGLGKTLTARYLATQLGAGVPFYELGSDELTPDRLRGAFVWLAERYERSIVFVDEIDQWAMNRDAETHSPETRLVLAAALGCIDGLVAAPGPIMVASSNRAPYMLDAALVRAGRLGFHIRFEHPREGERLELLRHFIGERPTEGAIDLARCARLTRGLTPADLRAMTDDGFGIALAAGRRALAEVDLLDAVRRSGKIDGEDDEEDPARRHRFAVHEAGHAAVACALRGPGWVYSIAIGTRDATTSLGPEGRPLHAVPDSELLDQIVVAYGGLAAERLIQPGGPSLGADHDIANATRIAIARVDAGLEASLAPIAVDELLRRPPEPLLNEQGQAMAGLLDAARERATRIVAANLTGIAALAAILETVIDLTGEPLREALSGRFVDEQGDRIA